MQINENQLKTWANISAQKSSTATYKSIQHALAQHSWPYEMSYSVYLQGSYKNSTNIRGDSDVDVIVEADNIFFYDEYHSPDYLRFRKASYGWREFRAEVKSALMAHYGNNTVKESRSGKCLKVSGKGNRLNADVVPCVRFEDYYNGAHTATGIAFWTNSNRPIINFPNLHYKNGSQKNERCNGRYKPNVRIFKNARNAIGNEFPSYFLECLLYNVPPHCFTNSGSYSDNFYYVLRYLHGAVRDGSLQAFRCQNRRQYLFGDGPHQTRLDLAHESIEQLSVLWSQGT